MKSFHCAACGSLVFFENDTCLTCGRRLGFVADALELTTLEIVGDDRFRAVAAAPEQRLFRRCLNGRDHDVCNWLVPAESDAAFCEACRLNEIVPDLKVRGNHERWLRLERAKRRLVYTLMKLGLGTDAEPSRAQTGLRFRFLGDADDGTKPMTGHADGVITLNIAEADDDVREQRRVSLKEPFRTLLGHFRHEVAHYYWDRLLAHSERLEDFRRVFGDERADYGAALRRHYEQGPPAGWQETHVSAYATMHPWEDWAETSAHYFHLIDTVETAASFGVTLRPEDERAARVLSADPREATKTEVGFDAMLAVWIPLTTALNALNRGMGLPDLYPFALSTVAIEKLRFVHEVYAAASRI